MINLLMFHSGDDFPNFLEYSLFQIRLFNPNIEISFITDKKYLDLELFRKYGVKTFLKEDFYSDKIRKFESYFNYPGGNFWTLAATRLIYIENFMKANNLENVYHFENDILLYSSIEEYNDKFIELYKNIAITTGGPDKSMTGFMFIKKSESLELMTQFFVDTLEKYGVHGTRRKYGMDMVHEMSLMKFYGVEKGGDFIENLPILPFGEYSFHFDRFNSIFDPATWGQYVGGTRTEGPGAKPQDHYIGQVLRQSPDYTVEFKTENGLKVPYFSYLGNYVRINNLHIHSKNLKNYTSR